jgi:histone H3/H4
MPALTVKSAVRRLAKGYRISPQFFKALDKAVGELVKKAAARAKANGRKTLRPHDL